jgi:hypothetical protein
METWKTLFVAETPKRFVVVCVASGLSNFTSGLSNFAAKMLPDGFS